MKVKVYSTPTCPYCKMVKSYLDQKGITYEDFDVSIDRMARDEMVRQSGQMGVPVIDIDGQIVVGFDRDRLDKILRK
ncbi:MAG: glutaredoxin family protein [bacterium]